jgi:hypothetical protein
MREADRLADQRDRVVKRWSWYELSCMFLEAAEREAVLDIYDRFM